MATGIFMSENKDNVGRNVRRSLPQQFVRERGFSH